MASLDLIHLVLLIGAALVLVGIISSLLANRFGAPLLLVFLVIGMLAGEDGPGGIVFNDFEATYLVGSLALSVILFDGGLRTRLAAFRGTLLPATLLATVGVLLTAVIVAAAALIGISGLTPLEALLLGGIVASTDAAAVFFLMRTGGLRLQPRVGAVLEIESGTNDPIAVFVTIAVTEAILSGAEMPGTALALSLVQQGTVGFVAGLAAGFALVAVLNRVAMPGGLHPPFVVAAAVTIYAATGLLGGSGLLAVYVAGLVMANRPVRALPSIIGFHDAATWVCQIGMFLVLGLLVTPSTLINYAAEGVAIALVLIAVARPLAVAACLLPFGFTGRETLFVSWVGLRGAVSIFLAAIPMLAGAEEAALYFNVAFFVVLVSLLLQGWTIPLAARRLGLAMRRTAPAVRRIELDIPGQTEQEMVGYPIGPDSLVLGLSHLPPWARVVMVARGGVMLDAAEAGALQPGDFAYLLAPMQRIARLDRLFEDNADMARRLAPPFGELPVNGNTVLASLAALYGLEIAAEDAGLTIAQLFERSLRAQPQTGARLPLSGAMLVARVVEGGQVVRAGLQLEELVDSLVAKARRRTPAAETGVS